MRPLIKGLAIGILILCSIKELAATTVLVFVSPREAVVAADSLSNRLEGGQRLICKIAQVSEHMLFMATGIGRTENPHFDPYELARIIATNNRTPRQAAVEYVREAISPLEEIWQLNRSRYFELGAINGGIVPTGPQDFMFIGLNRNGFISFSGTNFVEVAASAPRLRANEIHELSGEHPDDIFLYKSGVVADLPTDDQIDRWIYSVGPPAALKRAIEKQIKGTPKLVGGEISVVRLRRDGSVIWINRGECPQKSAGVRDP